MSFFILSITFCSLFIIKRFQLLKTSKSPPKTRRVLGHQVLTREAYDQCILQTKEGSFLARISKKRFNWYIRKGLATQIDENTIRINFDPKGNGNIGDKFYESEQLNRCVSCGTSHNYTKHHVIPHEYRKHFPLKFKGYHSHDIVLLCAHCHETYETEAAALRIKLSKQYNVPLNGIGLTLDKEKRKIVKLAVALLTSREKLPDTRIREIEQEIRGYMNKPDDYEITKEDLEKLSSMQVVKKTENFIPYGKAIVLAVAGGEMNPQKIDEFCIMWRKHFVETLKPKFLNPYWDVNRSIAEDPRHKKSQKM